MDSSQQQRAASPYKGIVFVVLTVLVILLTGCVLFLWEIGYFVPVTSEAQARKLLEKAGGVDVVAGEAGRIFKVHQGKGLASLSIYDPEITNYPAMGVLLCNSAPKSLLILPQSLVEPPEIRILYGPHSHLRILRIFDTTNRFAKSYEPVGVQISSNIFLTDIPH